MFNVYDVFALDVSKFIVWTENNIDGATKFHNQQPELIRANFPRIVTRRVVTVFIRLCKKRFRRRNTNGRSGDTGRHCGIF